MCVCVYVLVTLSVCSAFAYYWGPATCPHSCQRCPTSRTRTSARLRITCKICNCFALGNRAWGDIQWKEREGGEGGVVIYIHMQLLFRYEMHWKIFNLKTIFVVNFAAKTVAAVHVCVCMCVTVCLLLLQLQQCVCVCLGVCVRVILWRAFWNIT